MAGFNANGELVPTVDPDDWTPASDSWKVRRKGAKVRMRNPAALMEGKGGLTISVDKKNGVITIFDGRRAIMRVTEAQLNAILEKN